MHFRHIKKKRMKKVYCNIFVYKIFFRVEHIIFIFNLARKHMHNVFDRKWKHFTYTKRIHFGIYSSLLENLEKFSVVRELSRRIDAFGSHFPNFPRKTRERNTWTFFGKSLNLTINCIAHCIRIDFVIIRFRYLFYLQIFSLSFHSWRFESRLTKHNIYVSIINCFILIIWFVYYRIEILKCQMCFLLLYLTLNWF